jgi:NAD(P)-dependent dehydrogenase (short-subunit alcohol dehydrogenase family)
MELFSLQGKIALVIGGTGILGGSMAEALADAGAQVVVCGRSEERGNACVERIRQRHGAATFFACDATLHSSLIDVRREVTSTLGIPTILVNAAGGNEPRAAVSESRAFEEIELADWYANFDLNLVGGALLPCQVFGPAMVQNRKGSIINIASIAAHVPLSRVVAYSAAKAALLNLTRFLAREWARSGVRVNSITPGFFPAEQNRALLFDANGTPTPRAASILAHTPMGRFGSPDELRGAVIFLASEQASGFVTGADIWVDGGFLSQTI